jgi:hypothetical protein
LCPLREINVDLHRHSSSFFFLDFSFLFWSFNFFLVVFYPLTLYWYIISLSNLFFYSCVWRSHVIGEMFHCSVWRNKIQFHWFKIIIVSGTKFKVWTIFSLFFLDKIRGWFARSWGDFMSLFFGHSIVFLSIWSFYIAFIWDLTW